MNVKTCASSDVVKNWESIDWNKAKYYVKRLQMRIVKAQKEGRHAKVKSLQWLLTHSFYAKALAVKRVTENQGKNTAGVDQELWGTSQAKFKAILKLKRRGYTPQPLKRVYIPKSNGKMRPLGIPTMTDRAMQTLYKFALEPIAETTADHNSYGFRTGRGTHDAIEQCFTVLSKGKSPSWILEGDIKGCFDHISHQWLYENIPMDKLILEKWLKCGFVEMDELFPTEEGTPQGGTISPILANMALDGLEKLLNDEFYKKKINGKVFFPKVNLVRYCDDFIITGHSKEILEYEVLPLVKKFMQVRGLQLSEEKTLITHIDKGFDFLGQNVRKYKGKLLIKPSKKNTRNFLEKVRNFIKSNQSMKQEFLIRHLNPIIHGWVEYHKFVVSTKAFERVDFEIWRSLWQWAVRRHPKKSRRWIAKKYFNIIGNRTWTFSVPTKSKMNNGETLYIRLVYATNTEIRRFRKIIAEANPFDVEWIQYFEEREGEKMINSIRGRNILTNLWKQQNKQCPVCGERITLETGFKVHDTEIADRRVKQMVHPNCHNKLHLEIEDFEPVF